MYTLRRYDWTFHLATIAVCSYFLAQAITTYIASVLETIPVSTLATQPRPAQPAQGGHEASLRAPTIESYQVIANRNVFNSAESAQAKEVSPEEMTSDQLGTLGPAVQTTLDIKLLGTLAIYDGIDRRSSATISGGTSSAGRRA